MKWFGQLIAGLVAMLFIATPVQAQERIVSLGGDVTEILYALGVGDKIVATDSTSVWPPAALATPKVGYVRNLSAEGVLSIEPDLIIISGAAGPETAVDLITQSGVTVVHMEKTYSIEGIVDKTQRVAEAVDKVEAGDQIIAQLEAEWAAVQPAIDALPADLGVLFFSSGRDGVPQAAGTDTAAHGIIELLNAENLFGSQTAYKPISLEAAIVADPDVILVMSHNATELGGLDAVGGHPSLALTGAAQRGDVFAVESAQAMSFGLRTPYSVGKLAEQIALGLTEPEEG